MISIIIPTLNEEKYLPNLLDSIAIQTYPNYEVIVVDASSGDRTVEVTNGYEKKFSVTIIEGAEKNTSEQRNKGAEKAKGDILIFMDADTRISSSDFLLNISKKFYRELICAAVTNVYVEPKEEKFSDKIFHFMLNKLILFLNAVGGFGGRGGCQIIRKTVFEKVGGYNKNLMVAEDVDLYRRVAKKVKIHFLKHEKIYESPRRYRKEGYLKVIFKWIINGIYSFLFKKSFSKDWIRVG